MQYQEQFQKMYQPKWRKLKFIFKILQNSKKSKRAPPPKTNKHRIGNILYFKCVLSSSFLKD